MTITSALCRKLWRLGRLLHSDCKGQDFIEYAMITGFVACAVITMSPAISDSFITIMSKANSILIESASS